MESLRDYSLDTLLDVLLVKSLALMKASNWDLLILKRLAINFEIQTESHLGLILEQS